MKDAFKKQGGGGGGSGGGGGGGDNSDGLVMIIAVITGTAAAGFYVFRNLGNSKVSALKTHGFNIHLIQNIISFKKKQKKQTKEISWQEFQSHVLESGQVERLIVSNKKIAKVVMRAPVAKDNENAVTERS
jgi:hypothetical protein